MSDLLTRSRRPVNTSAMSPQSLILLAVTLLIPIAASAQDRGVQLTPDSRCILANKDVGAERWAITQNQDDGTVTGNVFRTAGGAPAFIFCEPNGELLRCFGADACSGATSQRGIQTTPDGRRTLVNKDVGAERWAISRNQDDGTVTGNVFRADGGPPAFILRADWGEQLPMLRSGRLSELTLRERVHLLGGRHAARGFFHGSGAVRRGLRLSG